jgi:hypothetical protein
MTGSLALKRASKFRPGGPWSNDDYDVFTGERHVGRIMVRPLTAGWRGKWSAAKFSRLSALEAIQG